MKRYSQKKTNKKPRDKFLKNIVKSSNNFFKDRKDTETKPKRENRKQRMKD